MNDDDKIAGLDQWAPAEPTEGFADRVMAARGATAQKSPRPLRAMVGAALLLVSAALWLLAVRGGDGSGDAAPEARASVKIGRRGVAVAEAGARLHWQVKSGEARVQQTAGNVFYRVEHGGPFVVATPAGEVTVQGTCFRVEVEPMLEKRAWVAAGVGAMAAATILVTVYEGRVLLANEHGKTMLSAGEEARARSGEAPGRVNDALASKRDAVAQKLTAPPAEGITREELLARDQQQRNELDKLRSRVHELELSGAADPNKKKDERPFFDPSKEELQSMAKDCKLKWDHPSIGMTPQTLSAKRAAELGFSDQEQAEINRVNADENSRVLKDLRALYVEVTGDKAGAEALTPQALEEEVLQKSPEDVVQQIFYRLSHERAGLQPPPADLKAATAAERMMRELTGLGDDYEQKLGAAIGPDRARQLRSERGGWDNRSQSSHGCPGEE